jgi:pimeloyl-ACP methyl ester carboxylesterase
VTYAYDQRGFGQSPTRGRWPGTETLVDDARAVAALLQRATPTCRSMSWARAWAARSPWSLLTAASKPTA